MSGLLALALPSTSTLISLILVIALVGVVIYLVRAYAPIDGPLKSVVVFLIALVALIYLLRAFGAV